MTFCRRTVEKYDLQDFVLSMCHTFNLPRGGLRQWAERLVTCFSNAVCQARLHEIR